MGRRRELTSGQYLLREALSEAGYKLSGDERHLAANERAPLPWLGDDPHCLQGLDAADVSKLLSTKGTRKSFDIRYWCILQRTLLGAEIARRWKGSTLEKAWPRLMWSRKVISARWPVEFYPWKLAYGESYESCDVYEGWQVATPDVKGRLVGPRVMADLFNEGMHGLYEDPEAYVTLHVDTRHLSLPDGRGPLADEMLHRIGEVMEMRGQAKKTKTGDYQTTGATARNPRPLSHFFKNLRHYDLYVAGVRFRTIDQKSVDSSRNSITRLIIGGSELQPEQVWMESHVLVCDRCKGGNTCTWWERSKKIGLEKPDKVDHAARRKVSLQSEGPVSPEDDSE